ncbi:MAG: radical SAM protein [Verrucomicrobia bacterium]|nr:radical SAM protein [Verrucomicrobiota bacterium]MBI3869603.1 radical SAM protein [Verrucomicrobiota bacterium]
MTPVPPHSVPGILTTPHSARTLLKKTSSRCPVCQAGCPAEVWKTHETTPRVFLDRVCPSHGLFSACLASDARFYWLSRGASDASACLSGACGCSAAGPAPVTLGRNALSPQPPPFEKLSTCLALIEIVSSCNLSCPTCYADAPWSETPGKDSVPVADVKRRIESVIERKGGIEILQLSGGEPTLHPDFFEILEWAQRHPKIDYTLLNTNGVRIAHDAGFASRLAEAAKRRKVQLYLQFDGPRETGQRDLRGADLRATRRLAIERAGAMEIPTTLAMTVTAANVDQLWESIAFGLEHPAVHGITFQPFFQSGRFAPPQARPPATTLSPERLNTADILLNAVGQSEGRLRLEDFTPLPCGDPNCATIGYLLRLPNGQGTRSISEFLDFSQVQGFLRDRLQYRLDDLWRCGCDSEPLGAVLKGLELHASMAFRIMVKPFMDAWTWDQDRIDRCCTHVIRPDGSLDSFCRHYAARGPASPLASSARLSSGAS